MVTVRMNTSGVIEMLVAQAASEYPLLNLFWTMFLVFGFVLWFWLLFVILTDLYRRHDVSGWGKAGWTVFVIVLPLIGILAYLIFEGRGMGERRAAEQEAVRASFERDVRTIAHNGQPAEQITAAKKLRDAGDITEEEYEQLKRQALAGSAGTTTDAR